MKRLVSKKSEEMFKDLMYETKERIKSEGNAEWKWANTPILDENRSNLRDMLRLVKSKAKHLENDLKFNIISIEKAELELNALNIVHKHLDERYAVMREVYE